MFKYGGDKGIFGYGTTGSDYSLSNLVSNVGVVATDTSGVGTARWGPIVNAIWYRQRNLWLWLYWW